MSDGQAAGPGAALPDPSVLGWLADRALDGLAGVGRDLRIVEVSEGFCRTVGRRRPGLVGAPFPDQFLEREEAAKGIRLMFDLGTVTDYKLTLLAADGRRVPVSLNGTAVHDSGGLSRMVVITSRDSTEQRELEHQLETRIRELLRRVTAAQDEERARIARDVHDDTIQVLAALSLRLVRLRSWLTEPAHRDLLGEAEHSVELAARGLRDLVFELRPPALDLEQGLVAVLREHVQRMAGDFPFTCEITGTGTAGLSPGARVTVYRIAMEALANVRKHAGASLVQVEVAAVDGGCHVRVRDDGRGFDQGHLEVVPGHLGVTAMRERAEMAGGWWRCESRPGAGALVEFWVPG